MLVKSMLSKLLKNSHLNLGSKFEEKEYETQRIRSYCYKYFITHMIK